MSSCAICETTNGNGLPVCQSCAREFVARLTCLDHIGMPALQAVCFASMSFQQAHQYFSAVWADGFPRSRHHAVSDVR